MTNCNRLPFDQATFYGYVLEMCGTTAIGDAYYGVNGGVLVVYTSMCFHHQAFTKIFNHSISILDQCTQRKHAKEMLCDLIRIRMSVQRQVFFIVFAVFWPFV